MRLGVNLVFFILFLLTIYQCLLYNCDIREEGKKVYIFKENIINVYNQRAIAREIGVTFETINRIFNRKQKCSKLIAYSICKIINQNAEIEDYFEIYKKGV